MITDPGTRNPAQAECATFNVTNDPNYVRNRASTMTSAVALDTGTVAAPTKILSFAARDDVQR